MKITVNYISCNITMFKEALICGMGMAFDLSGSAYSHNSPLLPAADGICSDWKHVGGLLEGAIANERQKVEELTAKQLQLKLG